MQKSTLYGRARAAVAIGILLAATVVTTGSGANAGPSASWTSSGNGKNNWRHQPDETRINAANVASLTPKWVFRPGADVSATPSVENGAVYVPDWGGRITKLDAATGAVIWSVSVPTASGVPGALSRTTPTLTEDSVIVGTQIGARLMSLDKATGAVRWVTQLSTMPFAILTQSPAVHAGVVYQGVSSSEEGAAAFIPGYICCRFIGTMNAVDLKTGQIKWTTLMAPNNNGQPGGYSGASIWSSSPVIDPSRNAVVVTTGNNYEVPDDVAACVAADPDAICDAPDNYVDAVVSLDMRTGAVRWATKLGGADAWNVACLIGGANCPTPAGPDYDFGQGAMLLRTKIDNKQQDILVAGQKSGVMWGLNPDTGAVFWGTQAGPGGTLGGLEWGSATDGKRIYFAIANNEAKPYDGRPDLGNAGSWGAIDPATGAILWQTKDPNGAIDPGAVSVANGVVYGGSLAASPTAPTFFALDAATGEIKLSYVSGGSVNSGAAIADGVVYWGSGYSNFGLGSPNNAFYALTLP